MRPSLTKKSYLSARSFCLASSFFRSSRCRYCTRRICERPFKCCSSDFGEFRVIMHSSQCRINPKTPILFRWCCLPFSCSVSAFLLVTQILHTWHLARLVFLIPRWLLLYWSSNTFDDPIDIFLTLCVFLTLTGDTVIELESEAVVPA